MRSYTRKTSPMRSRAIEAQRAIPTSVLRALDSPGTPLDAPTLKLMNNRFGHDFSRVRVHTDAAAADSAKAVSAEAYTVGYDIVFRTGRYAPQIPAGRGLLAHELAHVVQQRGNAHRPPSHVVGEGDPAEGNADALAVAAAKGQRLPRVASFGAAVMRATRTFSLTFDDGPHAAELGKGINLTERVLDALRAKGVRAGFFIQTAALDNEGHPMRGSAPVGRQLVKRMHREGHTIGIHTGGTRPHEIHPSAQRAGRLENELRSASVYVAKETGSNPYWVRPPERKFNDAVIETYGKVGLTNLLWDIDGDRGYNLPKTVLDERLTTRMSELSAGKPPWKASTPAAPKIVVLYHDIQKSTAFNIGSLIERIRSETSRLSGGADTAEFAPP